jgi:DeoR/GlpR family transcriptional regulator of sugar metabolism
MIGDYYFDIALIGVGGISTERGISTFTIGEAHTASEYIKHARSVWVVADHSKISRVAPALIAPLSKVHRIITNSGIKAEEKKSLESLGIEVIVASL